MCTTPRTTCARSLAARPRSQIRPLQKILCIKAIIFFTWWQAVGISLLVHFRLLRVADFNQLIAVDRTVNAEEWTADEIGQSLQDLLLCCEMLGFAIAHHYVFPVPSPVEYDAVRRACNGWDDDQSAVGYQRDSSEKLLTRVFDAVDLTEVVTDIKVSQKPVLTRKQELSAMWAMKE
jgi:hypothetical protein